MNSIACTTFTAQVTLGLFKGYSNELIPLAHVKKELIKAQTSIKEDFNIVLSAKLRHCEILCLGQDEPSIELEFIQYPKFQTEVESLKKAILALTKILMKPLEQNRIVIVFSDETVMLEQFDAIDPKIQI